MIPVLEAVDLHDQTTTSIRMAKQVNWNILFMEGRFEGNITKGNRNKEYLLTPQNLLEARQKQLEILYLWKCPPTQILSIMRCEIHCAIMVCLLLAATACQKDSLPPEPYFSVFPSSGDFKTTFYFDARKSADNNTIAEGILVRWDWEGDSIWDTPYSREKQCIHRYAISGNMRVAMQAKNFAGETAISYETVYISVVNADTGELVDERDGRIYKTVKFRDRWIMSENLRFGTRLQDSVFPGQQQVAEYHLYKNDPINLRYGGLYTWGEAMNYQDKDNNQGICPDGWHIPSFNEWNEMIGFPGFQAEFSPRMPVNVPYYYGVNSSLGLRIEFFGHGVVAYPAAGYTSLTSTGLGKNVGYWTSRPLRPVYHQGYSDRIRHFGISILLYEKSYGTYFSMADFNLAWGIEENNLDSHYVRCIKNN